MFLAFGILNHHCLSTVHQRQDICTISRARNWVQLSPGRCRSGAAAAAGGASLSLLLRPPLLPPPVVLAALVPSLALQLVVPPPLVLPPLEPSLAPQLVSLDGAAPATPTASCAGGFWLQTL